MSQQVASLCDTMGKHLQQRGVSVNMVVGGKEVMCALRRILTMTCLRMLSFSGKTGSGCIAGHGYLIGNCRQLKQHKKCVRCQPLLGVLK